MFALRDWLTPWYAFPSALLPTLAAVNLAYATFGIVLLTRRELPMPCVRVLFTANFAWAGVCAAIFVLLSSHASAFGLAHLAIEALIVGGLAEVERRRWRALGGASVAPDALSAR